MSRPWRKCEKCEKDHKINCAKKARDGSKHLWTDAVGKLKPTQHIINTGDSIPRTAFCGKVLYGKSSAT